MKDEHSIFSRSFSQQDQKKLGCGAFFIFFMAFTLCTIFTLPVLHLEVSMASGLKMLMRSEKTGESTHCIDFQAEPVKKIYNFSNSRSDVYEINGDIRIHGNSSTIFVASSLRIGDIGWWTVKPYPRKLDNLKIEPVRGWNVHNKPISQLPQCNKHFKIPAILFSTGAYSENYFHAFTDILIPLYLTSREFNGNVTFLVTDKRPGWKLKYKKILDKLSEHPILDDIDRENRVLCFSRVVVGLKSNKEFGVDHLVPPHYSNREFRQFLRNTFSLDRDSVNDCGKNCGFYRPRMLIISRKQTRRVTNEDEIANMARGLGFDVVVEEMGSNVSENARFANTFDVLIGVHGAGLTNMLFLPENAVVIQIIPIALHVASRAFFGEPAKDLNLKYIEYLVCQNESSFLGEYANKSEVISDPYAIHMKGGGGLFHMIYLTKQVVTLDLGRFKATLLNALELLRS